MERPFCSSSPIAQCHRQFKGCWNGPPVYIQNFDWMKGWLWNYKISSNRCLQSRRNMAVLCKLLWNKKNGSSWLWEPAASEISSDFLAEERILTYIQCAIPVFNRLFPDSNNWIILNLIFACAHRHPPAKLWLHTKRTLTELELATSVLGAKFKNLKKKTCSSYKTYELLKEQQK